MLFPKTWTVFKKALDGLFTAEAPVVVPADGTGYATANSTAVQVTATSRIYTAGVRFVNADDTNAATIGPAGIDGTSAHPGYFLPANGGTVTLPPCDLSTLYVYAAAGSPKVYWLGLDLA